MWVDFDVRDIRRCTWCGFSFSGSFACVMSIYKGNIKGVPLTVCWCNHTSQVWVMTRLVVASEVRESSLHFISPIIPPAVRLQLSDERHRSLLYKHLQSFKTTRTPQQHPDDRTWNERVLGRISLDRSENMRLMGRRVTAFHLKAHPVCFCTEIQLCGSDGGNKTESWWRRKGFHIPSPCLKTLMKCLASHHLYREIVSQMEAALKHLPKDWVGWYKRHLTSHTFSDKTKETITKPRQTVVSRTELPAWEADSTQDQLVKRIKTIPLTKTCFCFSIKA